MTFTRLLCALILAGLLVACGQRGPLYLPDDPAPAGTSTGTGNAPAGEDQDESEDQAGQDGADADRVHAGSFEDEQPGQL